MRLQRQSNQQIITLDPKSILGHGGEARVFALPQDEHLAAKVYHTPTKVTAQKLLAMLANPPENPTAAKGHISISWPIDVLRTADGRDRFVGFLMPRVQGMHSILEFYNPKTRRQRCPFFNYLYLHRTARNLVTAMGALHARGYCIGDINESNILVSDTALVTLVDTDSFQVPDPQNHLVYRCGVGKAEFTPPELQGKNFAQIERKPEHDLFGLAVLLFQLLMEGTHPFSGIYQGGGEPPSYCERIAAGHFVYGSKKVPYAPTPIAPAFELLHPSLQELFRRCFEQGHQNPHLRPNAQAWAAAIGEAEKSLVTCTTNNQHRYGKHLSACPWCDRALRLGGRDQFPSLQAVRAGQHLQPVKRKRVTLPANHQQQVLAKYVVAPPASNPRLVKVSSSKKKKFNPLMWGLIGTSALVCVEIMVIVNDLRLSPQTAANVPTNTPTASPSIDGNQISIAYYDQGNFHYRLGDYKGAIANFNQALLYNPNDANAYVNRGNARYEIAQHSSNPNLEYQAAIDDFNRALQLDPLVAEAYVSRGLVRQDIAQYSKQADQEYLAAISDFNAALRLDPKHTKAYIKRGIANYKLAQNSKAPTHPGYQEAIKDFDQALRLDAKEPEAYIKRGIVRYELAQKSGAYPKNYSSAIADLTLAAKLFLEKGELESYQEALSNICVALENKCQSFLQNPEKFITSTLQTTIAPPKPKN